MKKGYCEDTRDDFKDAKLGKVKGEVLLLNAIEEKSPVATPTIQTDHISVYWVS